jgi:hypothetical protein
MVYKTLPNNLIEENIKLLRHIQSYLSRHECDFGLDFVNNEECEECKIVSDIQYLLWKIQKWL